MKNFFHLDKYFSNRDIYGNVYSFLIITDNITGESLAVSDQGKNGSYILSKFFRTLGMNDGPYWTESDIWEKIRDFNRLEKFHKVQHLREEQVHEWLHAHFVKREVVR